MNASDKEVLARYEDLQMSAEDIAVDLSLDVNAVRMSLAQYSAVYRTELRSGKGEEKGLFEDFVMTKAKRVMGSLLDSEDSVTQFRAAKFIIDENTGRNNAAVRGLSAARNLGISVVELNDALRRARQQRIANSIEVHTEIKQISAAAAGQPEVVEKEVVMAK